MKVAFFLLLIIGFVISQSPEEIPPELKCYLKGLFKCRAGLKDVCSEFKGRNRIAVPIPKDRKELNGNCTIPVGFPLPKVNLTEVELPDCPCVDGNGGGSIDICFTCLDRENYNPEEKVLRVIKSGQEGRITISCKDGNKGVDIKKSCGKF